MKATEPDDNTVLRLRCAQVFNVMSVVGWLRDCRSLICEVSTNNHQSVTFPSVSRWLKRLLPFQTDRNITIQSLFNEKMKFTTEGTVPIEDCAP